MTSNNVEKSQELFQKNQRLAIYLYGVLDDDIRAEHLVKMMKYMHFKTEERYMVLLKIQSNNAGTTILGIPAEKLDRLNILTGN